MTVFTHGNIFTGTGEILEDGYVHVVDGKIAALGLMDELQLEEQATVIDLEGHTVTPGLIDPHSHISTFQGRSTLPDVKDGNEYSSPITPFVRGLDAIHPEDAAIERTRQAGFTTVFTGPGSANVIGGTGCAIKLRGKTADEMLIEESFMMKMALGENPKRFFGLKDQLPVTRMGVAGLLRKTLFNAKAYSDALLRAEKEGSAKPEPNFEMEALLDVIRGKQRCRIHAHRADDIVTAVRIAQEFELDFVIEHATEGYKIKNFLAENNVRCVVGPVTLPPVKLELWDISLNNARDLYEAGVTIALTEDTSFDTWKLPVHIGILIREGLPYDAALASITIEAAKIMKLDHRIGSLEVGKDADMAVFDGDPFSNYTRCLMTIIDGEVY